MKTAYKGNKSLATIMLGLGLILIAILAMGTTGLTSINNLNNAIDEYSTAGKLLVTLDKARLSELIYTRDRTEANEEVAKTNIQQSIEVIEQYHTANQNMELDTSLLMQLARIYQDSFISYVKAQKEFDTNWNQMVTSAKLVTQVTKELYDLQNVYIKREIELLEDTSSQEKANLKDRVAISHLVNELLNIIGEARQADRDFLLSKTVDTNEHYKNEVLDILNKGLAIAGQIESLLIRDQEKNLFKAVLPSVIVYRTNFTILAEARNRANLELYNMNRTAMEVNDMLHRVREIRMSQVNNSKDMSGYFLLIAIIFTATLMITLYLTRKTGRDILNLQRQNQMLLTQLGQQNEK